MTMHNDGVKTYNFENIDISQVFNNSPLKQPDEITKSYTFKHIEPDTELKTPLLFIKPTVNKHLDAVKNKKRRQLPKSDDSNKRFKYWTEEQTQILENCMKKNPSMSWTEISKLIPGKNGKQVRERWINVVNPAINRQQLSQEEKNKIINLVKIHGKKWVLISKKINNGRTQNHIKNFYNSYLLTTLKKNDF